MNEFDKINSVLAELDKQTKIWEKESKKQGKLIVIEGSSDGVGKQTQTGLLYNKLISEGHNVTRITFPNYNNPACTPVKMYLNGDFGKNPSDVNAQTASMFYAIDRFASYKMEWGEAYNNGGIVIADRYTTSNMVYQASKIKDTKLKDEFLDWLYNFEYEIVGLPKPDMVVVLDVPLEYSQKLIANRNNKFSGTSEKDIHETNLEFLTDTYNNVQYIIDKYDWTRINCIDDNKLKEINSIHNEVYSAVKKLIK